MGYYSTESSLTPLKNRVWDFSFTPGTCTGVLPAQAVETHQKTHVTLTVTASGHGRFLSKDPIGESGGLNLYGFVGNDPVNRIDYLGAKILSLKIMHGGKAQISDGDYRSHTTDLFGLIIGGGLGFRSKSLPKYTSMETNPMGGYGKVPVEHPARQVAGYKFEYVVKRICAEKNDSSFKITQSIVSGGLYKRKRKNGPSGQWDLTRDWTETVPSFPHDDGPSLWKNFPEEFTFKDQVTTVAGDMPAQAVEKSEKYEYLLRATWRVRAEDRQNAWEGKHKVVIEINGDGANGRAEILEEPREVAK